MAKVKISDLDAAAALDGTELVEITQDGTSVQTTTQDIADLGVSNETEITGTITGTSETPVTVYSGVGTDSHLFVLKTLFTCTAAGNGTTVAGEGIALVSALPVRAGALSNVWDDIYKDIADTSMIDFNWSADVNSGNLRLLFTAPSTAGSTTTFDYKISVSRVTI